PHNSTEEGGPLVSASLIRSRLREGKDIRPYVPASTTAYLPDSFWSEERFFRALQFSLVSHERDTLARIDEVAEGLENRISACALTAGSYRELVDSIRSRRYPASRIQRILLNSLLDIRSDRKEALGFSLGPSYIRVLGCRPDSRDLLGQLKKNSSLPCVIKPSDDLKALPPLSLSAFQDELRFSRIYAFLNDTAPANELTLGLLS
ncbi:MAG: nucleotidyltransferase family protein, partial [Lachnospiraceae bacterium]|nr:nucleotidyltransferase family protein [Lachnospiraceae bacterium]